MKPLDDKEPVRVDTPSRRRKGAQIWRDPWRGKDRIILFAGECIACSRNTYSYVDGENDPRGVMGDATASWVGPEDDERLVKQWPVCALCANTEERYREAIVKAHHYERRTGLKW